MDLPRKATWVQLLLKGDSRKPIATCDFPCGLDPLSSPSRSALQCFAIVAFVYVPLFVCVLVYLLHGASGLSLVFTFDFSPIYTTLPHYWIIDLIERTFNRGGFPYLACNDRSAFLRPPGVLCSLDP